MTDSELMTSLPNFHKNLLSEGCTERGTEEVLTQKLRPYGKSDNPGIIYVPPELVTDIKDCKYGLVCDTSYKKCHR